LPKLHAISTGRQSLDKWMNISLNIHNYVDYLHIRERNWSQEKKKIAIQTLLKEGVPENKLILNNEPDLTEKFQLKGVHFPENIDIENYKKRYWQLGISIHDYNQAVLKERQGADYLFFGNVFETSSKPGLPGKGLRSLEQVIEAVHSPVIAIGGITPDRAADCISSGAAGVAVLSGIYEAEDPIQNAKAYCLAMGKEENHELQL